MLQVPALAVIEDVTVFSDDTRYDLFYLVTGVPTVRLDAEGNPVFLLVAYAFSSDDRAANPSLPGGGGYLNFDTALVVDPATQDKIRATLQPRVDAEWRRRSAGTPDERASVAGTTAPPSLEFDTPTWTRGKVTLDAPQNTALVSARVSEGSPSLLNGATAVFNLDLTPAGATFMQQTLLGPDGAGATDLTPVQVGYDLSFWARLPPVSIIVTADSQKIHEYIHKQLQGRGIDYCTTYDFDHTNLTSDTITASGAVTVSIDQGSASVTPDVLGDLRTYALDLLKQMITTQFFAQPHQSGQPGSSAPDGVSGDGSTFYLKEYDQATMHLDVHLQQRSVVEWPVFPQATLESFFAGRPASELSRYVRKISLDDPFWATLKIPVRVFADWTGPVSWVRVDLEYAPPGVDPKSTSFTFDATHADAQEWSQNIVGGEVAFRYRTTIAFKDRDPPPAGEWLTTTVPAVNIQAVAPAVSAAVTLGDVDFGVVSSVQVTLAYEDPDQGIAREEHTLVLTSTKQSDSWERVVYKPVTRPIQYRTRFSLASGDVQDDQTWHTLDGSQLVVNQDRSGMLRVSLLPSGDGWADVLRVMVDLAYADPNSDNYEVDNTIDLESIDQFKTWMVPLRNPLLRDYRYRWAASFHNGHLSQTDWQKASGDGALPIVIKRPGINVTFFADMIDFKTTPMVEVTGVYTATGKTIQETFVFGKNAAQSWSIDVPDGSPIDFTWQATYSLPGADPITTPPVREQNTMVILPAYRAPHSGKLTVSILGNLVDYDVTPLVGVDLQYDDDASNVHATGSFVLNKATPTATWDVDRNDAVANQFGYTLTYYTPDGNPHPQPIKHDTAPRIIIPRYTA
jgi:hypothetical protein